MIAINKKNILFTFLIITIFPLSLNAQSAEEIKNKISQQQSEISEIEKEIKKYEKQLTSVGKEKHTLQSAIAELDLSKKKINANINLAQRKINISNSTLKELDSEIVRKEDLIKQNKFAISETIRHMNEIESDSFVEVILNSDNVSNLWSDMEYLQKFQIAVRDDVKSLFEQKEELKVAINKKKIEQGILIKQKTELTTQNKSLSITQSSKKKLLNETKNRESTYQELLATKRKARKEFESQLNSLEEKLQYILDPSSIPQKGKGVFRWPLDKFRITQYFGDTEFAKTGAYKGKGHNGIDMGVPMGTPVKSVLSGNVVETGNTDLFPGCYSYGKWVLVEHVNGLTTVYGHLSDIAVKAGDPVSTGQVIAYSGSSGYSTGPHLHLSVFASEAVHVINFGDIKSWSKCAKARIPVAAWSAYLNPMDYLKEL